MPEHIHTLLAARDAAWEAVRYRRIDDNGPEATAARVAYRAAIQDLTQHPLTVVIAACYEHVTTATVDALMAACRAEDGYGN